MSTTAQEHAAETIRAMHAAEADLQDVQHRLQAHDARKPRAGASADAIKAWAREKGTLAAEVEAHEGIVAELRATVQQAVEGAKAEQKANWYEKRRFALAEFDRRLAPHIAKLNVLQAEINAERAQYNEAEQRALDEVWGPLVAEAQQLKMFYLNEYQPKRNQVGALLLPHDGPSNTVHMLA